MGLKKLSTKEEVDQLLNSLKEIAYKAIDENRSVEFGQHSSVPPSPTRCKSVNCYQINIWDEVTTLTHDELLDD